MWKRNLHCRLAAQRFKHQVWICPSTSSWSECFFLATALDNSEAPNVHLLMLYSFPNLGILHVTKKNVSKVLEERMIEAFRMGYNCGIYIHPEIDALQGEVRMPRELTGRRSVYFCLKFNQSNVISIQDIHFSAGQVRMVVQIYLLALTTFIPASPQRKWWHEVGCITIGFHFSSQKYKCHPNSRALMSLWSSLKVEDLR